jgi:hypothetical protein
MSPANKKNNGFVTLNNNFSPEMTELVTPNMSAFLQRNKKVIVRSKSIEEKADNRSTRDKLGSGILNTKKHLKIPLRRP